MPTLIDPQQIYPKRIGIYRGSLLIEYYNLQKDCFKKHVIPFDSSESTQKILQGILKNPKHSVFLRKVSPQHLKSIIREQRGEGHPSNINFSLNYNEFSQSPSGSAQPSGSSFNNTNSNNNTSSSNNRTNSYTQSKGSSSNYNSSSNQRSSNIHNTTQQSNSNTNKWSSFAKKKDVDESGSFNLSTSKVNNSKLSDKNKQNNFQDSHGYSMNFDQQSMNISVVPIKDAPKNQHIIEQQENYYNEQFQQLSAQKIQVPKQKQTIKQKAKQSTKKQKPKKQEVIQQFQFLDEQPDKKKKKKKKDKSKQKQKQKQKGEKKSKSSSEYASKQTSVKQQIPIEEQFDFI